MSITGRIGIIGVIAVIIIGSALGWAYLQNSRSAEQQNDQQATEQTHQKPREKAPTRQAPGRYTTYSEQAVANDQGRKVLFFHAPWCPQCRQIDGDITADPSAIPNGVIIYKTDYDSNQALRQQYGVTLQTTFVEVDDDGRLVDKYVAYNEPTFDAVKTNLLDD